MIQNAQIIGHNITPERYEVEDQERGSPGLHVRAHILSEILRNAQRWVKGYQSPASKSKEFGTLFDCLLLTPKQWPQQFAVLPADAPKKPTKSQLNAAKPSPKTVEDIKWWDAWTRDNPGQIVDQKTNASVHAALQRLREDKLIVDLIEHSAHAVMIVAEWHDKQTGFKIPLKALIDICPEPDHPVFGNSLWDLKTTQNASPRSFRADAQRYGYAIQAALYRDLWNAATREQRTDFGHVVIENYSPYEFRTPPPLMTQRFLGHGRLLYQKALGIYCQGLETGTWPSYDKRNGDWPLTDCDDWFLAMDTLYDEIEEPEEESESATETEPLDIIP